MMKSRLSLVIALFGLAAGFGPECFSQPFGDREPGGERRVFKVDGVEREALVYAPARARSNATPVVFVFHGHGGNARNTGRTFAMHRQWPEAISVYMQGLNTPGRLTDPEGKRSGWQRRPGDQGDRDLVFFDAVLKQLKGEYDVDDDRVYATGHSNGGAFTYLLWETRGDLLAAIAPSASASPYWETMKLKPIPVLHLAGEKDALVKYEWQRRTMEAVRKVNGCATEGKPWKAAPAGAVCTIYESKSGTPFVSFIHSGAHGFPVSGPEAIVKFFKQHTREKQGR